jgi:hypothetical protein
MSGTAAFVHAGLEDYREYQSSEGLGTHEFTITLVQVSNNWDWEYGGKNHSLYRSFNYDAANGNLLYSTKSGTSVTKVPFSIGGQAGDVPLEKRDYMCDWQGYLENGDRYESLKATFTYQISHKYKVRPSKDIRDSFGAKGIFCQLYSDSAEKRSAYCRLLTAEDFRAVQSFRVPPEFRVMVTFDSPINFAINAPSDINARLNPSVFK